LSFLNEIDPYLSFFRDRNFSLSPVICFEQPLSTYHPSFLCWAYKASVHSSMLNWSCFFIRILCSPFLWLFIL
jgi:hypothetical protein